MEINLTDTTKQFIGALLLIVLPLIIIGAGLVFNILNAWYYVGAVTWFAFGLIFFSAID